MPDPSTPLALPMLMQSGTTPQVPASSLIPWDQGTAFLEDLRQKYQMLKNRLARLRVEQTIRDKNPNSFPMMLGANLSGGPAAQPRMEMPSSQVALEVSRLEREIKAMEQQHPYLTEPSFINANLPQLFTDKLQQDVEKGLMTAEQAGTMYSQTMPTLQGQMQAQQDTSATWQQPGQPTTGAGQPAAGNPPYPARMLGMTQEDWDQAPADFKRNAHYYLAGVQPPQRFDPIEAMKQGFVAKALGAGKEPDPFWWDNADPSQQRAYINMQSGKQTFDPMQFFQGLQAQSAENKKWREQMALAQRELDAQIANQQASRAMQQQQLAAEQAYQQQALAQAQAQFEAQLAAEQAYRQQQIEQARREMAAQIGTSLNAQQSQNWAQALPYVLPYGTQTPPGFEAGGPVNALATMAGQQNYTPMQISPSPQPERDEMEALIKRAIESFK